MNALALSNARDHDDIHVVAGHPSPALWATHLRIENDGSAPSSLADALLHFHPELDLRFTPVFKHTTVPGALIPSINKNDALLEGFNISVSQRTGQVTVTNTTANPMPSHRPFNFALEARLTSTVDANLNLLYTFRVHVHLSVGELWLTPSQLTIRPPLLSDPRTEALDPKPRFAVRAKFDDGVIGDVTDDPHLVWNTTSGHVDAEGYLDPIGITPGSAVDIKAHLSYETSKKAQGKLVHRKPWSAEPAIIAVNHRFKPNDQPASDFPNVLILGDGYKSATLFEECVVKVIDAMRQPLLQPFGLLAESINFWSAHVPSNDAGCSTKTELDPDGGVRFFPFTVPGPPDLRGSGSHKWSSSELAYMVGFPLPADKSSTTGRSDAQLLAQWTALLGFDPSPQLGDATRTIKVLRNWREIAARTLADELDTVFHVTTGRQSREGWDRVSFAPGRMDRPRIDEIIDRLEGPVFNAQNQRVGQAPIGELWKLRPEGQEEEEEEDEEDPMMNQWDLRKPKDYDLVCILVQQPCRSYNSDGYMFVSMFFPLYQARTSPATNRVEAFCDTTPSDELLVIAANTAAHEMAHSFGIGDEYTEEIAQHFRRPYSSNVQDGSIEGTDGNINAAAIQWSWDRMDHAAILAATIATDPDGFLLLTRPNDPVLFRTGQVVQLRFRKPSQPVRRNADVSVPLRIRSIQRIRAGGVDLDSILVEEATDIPFTSNGPQVSAGALIATFLPGSLLYVPVAAPGLATNDHPNNAGLVHWRTKRFFDGTKPALPLDLSGDFLASAGFRHHLSPRRIVAVYPGGDAEPFGRYHPTGHCAMGSEHGPALHPNAKKIEMDMSEFCAVCRFGLVDFIDPALHGLNDLFYDRYYS